MDREKKNLIALIGCLTIGSVLLLAACVVGTAGYVMWQVRPVGTVSVLPPSSAFPDIARVSVEEAYAAHTNGTSVFVDSRSLGLFQAERIPGALSIPVDEISNRLDELDPDDWIITYCT